MAGWGEEREREASVWETLLLSNIINRDVQLLLDTGDGIQMEGGGAIQMGWGVGGGGLGQERTEVCTAMCC